MKKSTVKALADFLRKQGTKKRKLSAKRIDGPSNSITRNTLLLSKLSQP